MRSVLLLLVVLFAWRSTAAQQVTVDLGFVSASGNANFTSLNVGEKLTHKLGVIALIENAKILYGRTNGATTTESYDVGARASR